MSGHKLHEDTLVPIDRKGDGWHGVPGCSGCVDPVNMQHQEGCRLRAKAAGHRHVVDILGNAVYFGDEVVAMVRHRSGSSSHNHYLVPANVVAILPKTVVVAYDHPAPWKGKPVREESRVPDSRLVKVRR